jgi:hypothetical protein
MTLPLRSVLVLALAASWMACREGVTFLPSDPTTVRDRILSELEALPSVQTRAISAGVTVEVARIADTRCETGEVLRFLMDWSSDANHLTIALYQTGEGPTDSSDIVVAQCRVPGSSLPVQTSHPICPIVASVMTTERPKALQQSMDRLAFSIVVTNNGPGNETIRWALQDVGRHTRVCARPTKLHDTAHDHSGARNPGRSGLS